MISHAGHSPGFGKKKNKLGRDWYNLQDQIVVMMYLLGVDIPRAYTCVFVCYHMLLQKYTFLVFMQCINGKLT